MTRPAVLRHRRAFLAAAFTTFAASALIACTSTRGSAPTAATPPTSTVTTLAGATVRIPADKPAAVFFFSVGCGECLGGGKSLAQAAATVGDKAQFLAVDMDPGDSKDAISGFLHAINSPELPTAIDTGATLSRAYQVSALSTLLVVDPAGKVTYRATDPTTDQIRAALAAAGAR
ncbi:TlpA disulfide reductase family protein [Mycobacterium sp.]|uniref:TlpA family protein disulfide reductase n=1 Tax=Mycobacterium sp. TaxID=1785 RepID=UPI0031E08805